MKTKIQFLSVFGLLLTIAGPVLAQQDDITSSRRNAIVRAIEKVAPAVCSVNVVQVESQRVMDPFSDGFWNFFDVPRARTRERRINSIGSGFIIDKEGHILTNYHVLEGAARIASVALPDGREIEAEYVGGDNRSDLAVLKAHTDNLPYVTLGNSDDLLTGEWVIAVGNPFGPLMNDPQPTVSIGIVSANHRRVSREVTGGERYYQDLIQTDAAINPGNSGGPLVNAAGEVVGINTLIFSESGGSVGLGFALPINRIQRVANEILQYGKRWDPWPGFSAEDVRAVRPDVLAELGVRAQTGCLVTSIVKRAPAFQAGLRLGDVITAVNDRKIEDPSEIDFAVWGLFVGDKMTLTVDRQGSSMTFTFDIVEVTQ